MKRDINLYDLMFFSKMYTFIEQNTAWDQIDKHTIPQIL